MTAFTLSTVRCDTRVKRFAAVCFVLLFAAAAASHASTPEKRILILGSEDMRVPASVLVDKGVREGLANSGIGPIQFYVESMETTRIQQDYTGQLIELLQRKYSGQNLDLIFAYGQPALLFLSKHEAVLFPNVPKIYAVLDPRDLEGVNLGRHTTGVAAKMEFNPTVELMLAQNPEAKKIVIVAGQAPVDRAFLARAQKDFAELNDKVEFQYLANSTADEVKSELAALSKESLVLFLPFFEDRAGRLFTYHSAISYVAPTSSVPIYGLSDAGLGAGIVGGYLLSAELAGKNAADMAVRILAGEDPQNIPHVTVPGTTMFDARELKRWNIDESTLPEGSIVQFRVPTLFEEYRGYIIAATAVLLIQSILLISLLVSQMLRRRTERERNEFRSLAADQHARLNDIVSNVPGIVWETRVADESGRRQLSFVNGYVEEMLGYSVEECLANPELISSRVADEDRESFNREAEMAFLLGGHRSVQFRFITKGGGQKWAESRMVAIRDDSDSGVGLRGVTMDITQQVAAVAALTESEARYRNVVETQTDMICRYTEDTALTFVNDAFCRYFEKTSAELIGTLFVDLIAPHAREKTLDHVFSLLAKGNSQPYECEVIRPDGTRGWHKWVDSRVETPDGARKEVQGVGRDVTEKRIAQEELRISENRFKIMADSAPVLIWMCDPDGQCTYVNKGWLDFTGRPLEAALGQGWTEGISPHDASRAAKTFDRAFDRKEPFRIEYRLRDANNEFRWMYVSGAPRIATDGECLGFIGSCVDISDRKAAEEVARKAHEEVEQMRKKLHEENIYLKEVIKLEHNFEEIIGHSDALKYLLFKVEQVGPTDATVLITGETGTGKELIARAIHSTSLRRTLPLVSVNCAALSPNLIESELFGHVRGAFTGAVTGRTGRFELADRATIFLDEVGELPLEVQAKLLRVIEEGEFERLGSSKTIKGDVRIIAATNRNLEAEVNKGRFRGDLLYRLNVFPITVPPLRERKEDIPELVEHFTNLFVKKIGKNVRSVSPGTLRLLTEHSWPGNIRELANVIERAVISAQKDGLLVTDALIRPAAHDLAKGGDESLKAVESRHIWHVLEMTNWRIEGSNGAARVLGLNPSTLRTRMLKLGISRTSAKNNQDVVDI